MVDCRNTISLTSSPTIHISAHILVGYSPSTYCSHRQLYCHHYNYYPKITREHHGAVNNNSIPAAASNMQHRNKHSRSIAILVSCITTMLKIVYLSNDSRQPTVTVALESSATRHHTCISPITNPNSQRLSRYSTILHHRYCSPLPSRPTTITKSSMAVGVAEKE